MLVKSKNSFWPTYGYGQYVHIFLCRWPENEQAMTTALGKEF
jgi:hypothetical protein